MVTVSKSKAKRLGIPESKRHSLTRSELTNYEKGSGQYVEKDGKTLLKKNLDKNQKIEYTYDDKNVVTSTKPKVQEENVTREPIILEKEKTGIAAFREKDTLAGKAVKAATSLKTTAILATAAGVLASAGGLIGGAAAGGTAVQKAAIVGRTASTGGTTLTRGTVPIARAFQTNAKSLATTQSWFGKLFSSTKTVTSTSLKTGVTRTSRVTTTGLPSPVQLGGIAVAIFGSYPFANFIKEEALQTLSFATKTALENKDIEGGREALEMQMEFLNPDTWNKILGAIPFVNILAKLKDFYKAATKKVEIDSKAFAKLEEEITNPEETFEESSERIAGERRKEELLQRQRDAEYYKLIREKRFEEAEELLNTELEGGN